MRLEHAVVVTIAGLAVTSTVIATAAMVAVLSGLAVLAGRRLRRQPSRWQAVAEWGLIALRGMLDEVTGDGERYLPLVATVGIFILGANTMSVLPFLEAPTADINTPVALAVVVFFAVHYYGIRGLGARAYLEKFTQPVVIFLPLNILANLTRTFSLAIRLFGNMVSHQIIVAILLVILPLIVPAMLELFGLAVGLLQAYIFTMLTIVYIGGAVSAGREL